MLILAIVALAVGIIVDGLVSRSTKSSTAGTLVGGAVCIAVFGIGWLAMVGP
jgi:hypothetical protein